MSRNLSTFGVCVGAYFVPPSFASHAFPSEPTRPSFKQGPPPSYFTKGGPPLVTIRHTLNLTCFPSHSSPFCDLEVLILFPSNTHTQRQPTAGKTCVGVAFELLFPRGFFWALFLFFLNGLFWGLLDKTEKPTKRTGRTTKSSNS